MHVALTGATGFIGSHVAVIPVGKARVDAKGAAAVGRGTGGRFAALGEAG